MSKAMFGISRLGVGLILICALATPAFYINATDESPESVDGAGLYFGDFDGLSLYLGARPGADAVAVEDIEDLYLLSRLDGAAPVPPGDVEVLGALPGGGLICRLRPRRLAALAVDPALQYRALTPLLRYTGDLDPPTPAGGFDDEVELVELDSIDAYNLALTNFRTRYTYSEPINDARDYLVSELEACGFEVTLESWLGEHAISLAAEGQLVLLGTRMSYAFFSTDGGTNFKAFLPPEGAMDFGVYGCEAFAPETFYYGAGTRFHRSIDSGWSWQGVDLFEAPRTLRAMDFADVDHGYAVDASGGFRITDDGGLTWSEGGAVDGSVYDICAPADHPGVVYAVGGQGSVWRSLNHAGDWELVRSGQETLRTIAYNAGVYVTAGNGVVLRSENGDEWTSLSLPDADESTFFLGSSAYSGRGFVLTGQLGTLWISDDGESWRRVLLPTGGVVNCADDGGVRLWVAGQDGPLSSSDGESFTNHIDALDPDCEVVWQNVIGEKTGTEHPESNIYLTAHYDSIATDVDPYTLAPGANDNGSADAALLEAARVLADHQPRRTLRVAFFSAEELGLHGSYHHVNNLVRSGGRADAVLNVDMVVWSDPAGEQEDLDIICNGPSAWLADYLVGACADYGDGMPGYKLLDDEFFRSDHAPFWYAGFPAVLTIEDFDVPYPYYHTSQDDYPTIQDEFNLTRQVTRAVVGAVLGLTGGEADWEGDLTGAYAYPNPYRPANGGSLTFTGLTPGTEVRVHSVDGSLLYNAISDGPTLSWSAVNDAGAELAAGVYLFVLRAPDGETKSGRLAVIR